MAYLRERLSGKGRLFQNGKLLGAVQYEVRVYPVYVDTSTLEGPSRIPGVPRVECRLDPSPGVSMSHQRLTLVMDDGRKLDFFVIGENVVKPTGEIYS
ncbi:MAG: hypothetical protein ABSA41_01755 [Terriglobia bacterium]|jgi:hypothetical protein